jgi:molybdopterin converting factor small subunit
MQVVVHFHSYFKERAGCAQTTQALADGGTIADLLRGLEAGIPQFTAMQKSMLIAVGVEYQKRDYVLKPGDEVSLFPPVQGG